VRSELPADDHPAVGVEHDRDEDEPGPLGATGANAPLGTDDSRGINE
jgi:hypothetical protein